MYNKYLQKIASVSSLDKALGTARFARAAGGAVFGGIPVMANPRHLAALRQAIYAAKGASTAGGGNRLAGALAGMAGGNLGRKGAELANEQLLKHEGLYIPLADEIAGFVSASAAGKNTPKLMSKAENIMSNRVNRNGGNIPGTPTIDASPNTVSSINNVKNWVKKNPGLTAAGALGIAGAASVPVILNNH